MNTYEQKARVTGSMTAIRLGAAADAEIARLQAQTDALARALKTALPYINADVNEPGGPVALAVSALAAVGR